MGSHLSSMVFQPPEVTYVHEGNEMIWLRTQGNVQIPAFYIPQPGAKLTILFSHGNAEDLGSIYEWFLYFSEKLKVNVFAYDYDGYGKASGVPSDQACYEDIEAAYLYLKNTLHIPSEHIVLYGRSLGSGPSLYLAEKLAKGQVRLGGVILQSPFLSIFRVAFSFRITLPFDMFPNIDRIPKTTCPIWVIHGTRDEVVPFWNGERLFLHIPIANRAKPFWVDGGGHNDLETFFSDDTIFFRQFREFFMEWIPIYCQSQSSFLDAFKKYSIPLTNDTYLIGQESSQIAAKYW